MTSSAPSGLLAFSVLKMTRAVVRNKTINDDHGNYRPGKLDLATAINLCGFVIRISCTLAETDEDVSKEASRSEKNDCCDHQHKHRQPEA